jgi:hypothetical protein
VGAAGALRTVYGTRAVFGGVAGKRGGGADVLERAFFFVLVRVVGRDSGCELGRVKGGAGCGGGSR